MKLERACCSGTAGMPGPGRYVAGSLPETEEISLVRDCECVGAGVRVEETPGVA